MKLFLVSYDLLSPGRDYTTLISAIQALGGRRVLFSQWAVRVNATTTTAELRDHLRRYMDANDRILINDFEHWASYNAMVDLNKAA
jgi:hypothetical protein